MNEINSETQQFRFNMMAFAAFLVLLLPLSIKVFFPILSSVIIFPGEILIGIAGLLYVFTLFVKQEFRSFSLSFLKHPITILVLAYLVINIVSALSSTMHLVSFKAVIVKSCYIIVFYFFFYSLIRPSIKNFAEMIKLYGFSLVLVVIYTLLVQSRLGFTRTGAGFACHPFYNDHTIYSAAIVFILPVLLLQGIYAKTFAITKPNRTLLLLASVILLGGLTLSYCRAAWVSLAGVLILLALVLIGLRFKGLMVILITLLASVILLREPIYDLMKQNKNDSNRTEAGFLEHMGSFTNVTNDYSNKERLNRWNSSLKMFKERPVLGFGPGTFQFQYLPFQAEENMTYLSLKKPLRPGFGTFYWYSNAVGLVQDRDYTYFQGGGGTAHSEYFLELAEGGIISALLFLALLFFSLFIGLNVYSTAPDKRTKLFVLGIILSLTTYFIHGFFNNFLDDCKIAFLFWTSLAALTATDLENKKVNSPF